MKSLAGGGLLASDFWIKPVVETIALPAHAQTSPVAASGPVTCGDVLLEITSPDATVSVPGPATVSVCVTNNGGSPLNIGIIGGQSPNGWDDWLDQVDVDIGTVAPGQTGCSVQSLTVTTCGAGIATWELELRVNGEDCGPVQLQIPCTPGP